MVTDGFLNGRGNAAARLLQRRWPDLAVRVTLDHSAGSAVLHYEDGPSTAAVTGHLLEHYGRTDLAATRLRLVRRYTPHALVYGLLAAGDAVEPDTPLHVLVAALDVPVHWHPPLDVRLITELYLAAERSAESSAAGPEWHPRLVGWFLANRTRVAAATAGMLAPAAAVG